MEPWKWQDDHPIVNVSWDDAVAYAKWAGAALPTEAQWEKAARGTDGRQYPWGNDWDAAKFVSSFGGNAGGTKPVGSCPDGISPYGALDMAGNVWEWCADWYDGSSMGRAQSACCAAAAGTTIIQATSAPPTGTTTASSIPRPGSTTSSVSGVRCLRQDNRFSLALFLFTSHGEQQRGLRGQLPMSPEGHR